jgi:hypothetical protein
MDTGARAELQIGSAAIHLDGSTSATLLNLDDSVAQILLSQGTLNVRVRRLGRDDVFEIDTPNLAFSIREPGDYRIDVDAYDNSTTVTVRSGQGEVYGEESAYSIYARQSYRFFGTDLRDYDRYASLPSSDEFDRWSNDRNRRGDNSRSARYVSSDVIGYEDLDEYGSWRNEPSYGYVWVPSRVNVGWAPYQDGHWVWINPWGWTWIDDTPWGFTVSHYGRWAHSRGRWFWVPGPIAARPVYAPALVVFVGGSNFQLSLSTGRVGGVGWFPLGPREVYRPAYPVSRNYFTNINTSNTVVNNVNITNVYNNTNVTNITYVNRQVAGAVIAVPATAFVKSQPVAKSRVEVSKEVIRTAPVSEAAAVAPVHESVRGAGPSGRKPPAVATERPVVAKTAPPPKPVPFAAQQPALTANPGKPLDEATLATVKPAVPVPAAPIKLVNPSRSRGAADKTQAGPSAPPQVQPTPIPSPESKGQAEPRKPRGQAVEPKTTAPPSIESPAEQLPATPTTIEPDRAPAARTQPSREISQAPSPEQKGPSEPRKPRVQAVEPKTVAPPSIESPAEPAPAPPVIIEPNRAPAARTQPSREIRQTPQPRTSKEQRGLAPNPESINEVQKSKEQLKREEALKRREMEDKKLNQ